MVEEERSRPPPRPVPPPARARPRLAPRTASAHAGVRARWGGLNGAPSARRDTRRRGIEGRTGAPRRAAGARWRVVGGGAAAQRRMAPRRTREPRPPPTTRHRSRLILRAGDEERSAIGLCGPESRRTERSVCPCAAPGSTPRRLELVVSVSRYQFPRDPARDPARRGCLGGPVRGSRWVARRPAPALRPTKAEGERARRGAPRAPPARQPPGLTPAWDGTRRRRAERAAYGGRYGPLVAVARRGCSGGWGPPAQHSAASARGGRLPGTAAAGPTEYTKKIIFIQAAGQRAACAPARSSPRGPPSPGLPRVGARSARPSQPQPVPVWSIPLKPRPAPRQGAQERGARNLRAPHAKKRGRRAEVRDGLQDELRHHPSSDQRPAWPPPRPRIPPLGACDQRPLRPVRRQRRDRQRRSGGDLCARAAQIGPGAPSAFAAAPTAAATPARKAPVARSTAT